MKSLRIHLVMALVAILMATGGAQATTLFLDSWGVSYDSWDPSSALAPDDVFWYVEDWAGTPSNGFLDPGYGGDNYDVEAVYAGFDNDYVYVAIVTGFPVTGGWQNEYYPPGDIALDTDLDSSFDLAVDTDAGGVLRRGSLVWENPTIQGQPAWGGVSDPLRVTAWNETLASTDWSYAGWQGRYAIEAVIDRSYVDPSTGFAVHWTMGCGNDGGDLVVEPATPVPEPATIGLLGLGLAGGGFLRRRRPR